ncbi:unnamed protein product [Pieris brassicae]|uniref:Uncharacterized protein n=1 Tax=Pieris brassicae TaxID=7116 RepID=A0A9P0TFS3_PIEBR|nr:unnamed protein product [Pieris brassicae]
MPQFSDNYYQRKCFFDRDQVPTQSVMKNKMSPPLAEVYFKSMTPKLKVLAGLEPPMKGGGTDWYVPPHDILQGKTVLKPEKKEHLAKLGFIGIDFFGDRLVKQHYKNMDEEEKQVLEENDANWKRKVAISSRQQWEETSKDAANNNTNKIRNAFEEFRIMYTSSINNVESLLFDAAIKEIDTVSNAAHKKMEARFKKFVKQQATTLYDLYANILDKEKTRLKNIFLENIEKSRTNTTNHLHNINLDKHVAVEKLRLFVECQNLACQAYVALKEREECRLDMEKSENIHQKKMRKLKEEIALKEFEIQLSKEKEKKRQEFIKVWKKKVCHVVKKFQEFVGYCLKLLPNHADFFINMEKLMLLHLSDAMENPSSESIFSPEPESDKDPVPRPHPFYVFCDKGFKPKIDQNLCPKHCTSSASHFPVVIVNNKLIYTKCDNFDMFPEQIKMFIDGHRGQDSDVIDDHDYTYDIPVKTTASQQILELKLESSIMQILQKEIPNIRNVPTKCCYCKIPYCFCSPLHASEIILQKPTQAADEPAVVVPEISSGEKITTRKIELKHQREPKWDSYMKYVEPQKCKCGKRAKKHLEEHLPAYMRKQSVFEEVDLPNYETCPLDTLKILVKQARGKKTPPPTPVKVESKTKNVCTQYSDLEFEELCTCFSDEEIEKLFQKLIVESRLFDEAAEPKFKIVDGSIAMGSDLDKEPGSFAENRAYSLRNLIHESPILEELFKKEDCTF